jgi:hypothetical protein
MEIGAFIAHSMAAEDTLEDMYCTVYIEGGRNFTFYAVAEKFLARYLGGRYEKQ